MLDDSISRQAAIDEAVAYIEEWNNAKSEYHKKEITRRFQNLPSAQPETDGFCTDCSEYDSERHFCPRFDRVIKKTVEEMGIIHCKDCKHWDKTWTNDWAKDYHYCPVVDGVRKASFYCADAERRPDEP